MKKKGNATETHKWIISRETSAKSGNWSNNSVPWETDSRSRKGETSTQCRCHRRDGGMPDRKIGVVTHIALQERLMAVSPLPVLCKMELRSSTKQAKKKRKKVP